MLPKYAYILKHYFLEHWNTFIKIDNLKQKDLNILLCNKIDELIRYRFYQNLKKYLSDAV